MGPEGAAPVSLAHLHTAHAGLEALARSAGYPGLRAFAAHLDDPDPLPCLQATWDECRGVPGLHYSRDGRLDRTTLSTAQANAGRTTHRLTADIKAWRAAGLTAAQQARIANMHEGTDYWTATRIRGIAHQMGLTGHPGTPTRA